MRIASIRRVPTCMALAFKRSMLTRAISIEKIFNDAGEFPWGVVLNMVAGIRNVHDTIGSDLLQNACNCLRVSPRRSRQRFACADPKRWRCDAAPTRKPFFEVAYRLYRPLPGQIEKPRVIAIGQPLRRHIRQI